MRFQESVMDLPRPNLSATPILDVQKSNLSRVDICKVISNITSVLETVRHDFEELREKLMENFQETDSFLEDYQELKQHILKTPGTTTRRAN